MEIDGIPFDLLDTAGLESIDDSSPRGLAQSFTQEQLEQSDLILLCHSCEDISAIHQPDQENDPNTSHNSETWRIITKIDLLEPASFKHPVAPHQFAISTQTGDGLESLKLAIQLWLSEKNKQLVDAMPMTAERCYDALQNATQAIEEALQASQCAAGEEIVAGEIRLALDEIGQVAGVVYTDDILDVLFSRFCIGK
jgi:tRNA modification GTPase